MTPSEQPAAHEGAEVAASTAPQPVTRTPGRVVVLAGPTAVGKGTVVADAPPAPDDAAVGAAVERAVALARAAGWDATRLRRAVDDVQRVRPDR